MEGVLVDLNPVEEVAMSLPTTETQSEQCAEECPSHSEVDVMDKREITCDSEEERGFKMEELIQQEGVNLLDEEFDFDLLSSPSSNCDEDSVTAEDEDEDEVFFGPVGHVEKCVAAVVEDVEQHEIRALSPLNEKQLAELVKEAQTVACKIGNMFKTKDTPLSIQLGKMSVGASTSSSSGSEETMSPGSRLRRETFSVNTSPAHLLPQSSHKLHSSTDSESGDVKTRDGASDKKGTIRRPVSRSATFSVKRPRLPSERTLQKPGKCVNDFNGVKKMKTDYDESVETCSVTSDTSDTSCSIPVSGKRTLPQPHVKSSRLAVPVSSRPRSASNSLHTMKTGTESKPTSSKAPTSKLQLMRPSGLLSRKPKADRSVTSTHKSGPVKALAPVGTTPASTLRAPTTKPKSSVAQCTPMKADRLVQPKRLLPGRPSSPVTPKLSSGSSCSTAPPSTPGSVIKSSRRRSFLPTPVKRSVGSVGTQSPRSVRSGSSQSSRNADSPVFVDENSYSGKTKTGSTKVNKLISYSDSSPSMKSRRPLVQHTPQVQPRKMSLWSPVQKARPHAGEEFYRCTKRLSNK